MSGIQTIPAWTSITPANKFFDTYIKGSLDVSGYLHLREGHLVVSNGDASLNGNVVVQKDVTIQNDLFVQNDADITGILNLDGDASMNAKLLVASDVSLNSKLYVASDVSLNSKLYVNGVTTLNGNVIPGNSDVTLGTPDDPFKALYITGNSLHIGTTAGGKDESVLSLDNSGIVVTTNDISFDVVMSHRASSSVAINKRSDDASANFDVSGTVLASGATTLLSTLDVSKATTISDTLAVSKATTLSSTLAVSNATTLSDTLAVSKATTLSSTLAVSNATTLSSTLAVTKATTLSDTLDVTKATTLSSTLAVSKATTLSDTLGVTKATTLSSTLAVSKATTLSSTLAVSKATTLSSTLNVARAVTMQNILTVTGDASFNADLQLAGNMGINTGPSDLALDINATNALRLPKGTDLERPVVNGGASSYKGIIRYNSDKDQFEGFGAGQAWGSLGGVKDVDQDTYILAESSAGADNDQLQFFTAGTERMIIDADGDASFNHGVNMVGPATMESTMVVGGDASLNSNLFVGGDLSLNGDLTIQGNLAVFQTTNTMTINTTVNDYEVIVTNDLSLNGEFFASGDVSLNGNAYIAQNVGVGTAPRDILAMDISATSGIRVPHGTEAQRPAASGSTEYGIVRYNTDAQGFEGYGIAGWAGLGGVKDADGDTRITADTAGGDTDVLSFTTKDVLGMTLSSTDLSVNAHVIFEKDASLNGTVGMASDMYVVGAVSLNSRLDVTGDVSFNNSLYVGGAIDVSYGITALTSSIVAQTFSAGTVEQFDFGSGFVAPVAAGSYYIHFEVGFQVTGDISYNTGARDLQF